MKNRTKNKMKNRTINRRIYRGGSKYVNADHALNHLPGPTAFDEGLLDLIKEENDPDFSDLIVKVQTCKDLIRKVRKKLMEIPPDTESDSDHDSSE